MGISIFLLNCKKLEAITNDSKWRGMAKKLIQSFHSFLNLKSTQMVSYIKNFRHVRRINNVYFLRRC